MYGDQEQNVQDEELITHVLSKYLNKEISDNGTNTRNLADYIHQFFDKILEFFKDLFGDVRVTKDDRITISGKDIKDALSYENLAELINSKQIRFNDRLVGNDYRNNIDANSISDKTVDFGVELNKGGAKTMQSDAKKWLQSNSDGIVAYRKYKDTPKTFTKETVDEGWIGNPFSTESKGKDTV